MTKELRQSLLLLLPLTTHHPPPSIIDGQGAFTISSSLAAKTINQSSVVVVVPSKKTKRSKSKSNSWPGIGWQSRKLAQFVHFPSSIVCSLFLQSPPRSKTSSLNQKAKNQHTKKAKKGKSSIVKRKGIKNNALSIRL
jgi:hypothetical protein